MSLLLKTIEAFPRGRTTSELMALLDVAFDGSQREAVRRELAELQAKGHCCPNKAIGRPRNLLF